ncbi:MAG: hypothetical protein ACOYB3_01235 [Azonexus sp.]
MKTIKVSIVGNNPGMLQANNRLANALDPMTKQYKATQDTLKKNKSDDNLRAKLDCEWLGHLYWDEGRGIYIPRKQLQASMLKAAKKFKAEGKRSNLCSPIANTVSLKGNVYIELPGGEPHKTQADLDVLRDDPNLTFRFDTLVSIGDATVLKTRPLIPGGWRAAFVFDYHNDDPEAVALTTVKEIVDTMGRGGVGDWRPNSPSPGEYGTFEVEKFEVSDDGKKYVEVK